MPIKNEKIGRIFAKNTKNSAKHEQKLGRPAWKNEKFEKIFLREKNFDFLSRYEQIFPYPLVRLCYILVLVWAWLKG